MKSTCKKGILSALDHEKLSKKQTNMNFKFFRPGDYVGVFWIDIIGK